jgi:sec-independent protein translocase protein TatA
MPFGLGIGELVLVFAVMLLLFGAKRLPEIGGAMGKSIRDFKRSINGLDDGSLTRAVEDPVVPQQIGTSDPAQKEQAAAPAQVNTQD